jgi:hypothetical protein
MTPEEVIAGAELFLKYYVEGTADPAVRAAFPNVPSLPGIFLRRPAVLEDRPEYTLPSVSPFDEQLFAAGEGPEGSEVPYLFVDRCPLARVRTTSSGTTLRVEFLAVFDFPGTQFPVELAVPSSDLANRRIRRPTSFGQHVGAALECLDQLQDFLGGDLSQIQVEHTVTLLTLEELNALPT